MKTEISHVKDVLALLLLLGYTYTIEEIVDADLLLENGELHVVNSTNCYIVETTCNTLAWFIQEYIKLLGERNLIETKKLKLKK